PVVDTFRVEWERAAWEHAGDGNAEARAKAELVRWRLHTLLADMTGELHHYYDAALARPDLAPTRAALGCALARQGRLTEAIGHRRQAVGDNPFDADAARALAKALGDAGEGLARRRLARQRRLLWEAAPDRVQAEPWFAQAPPVGDELVSIIVLCC